MLSIFSKVLIGAGKFGFTVSGLFSFLAPLAIIGGGVLVVIELVKANEKKKEITVKLAEETKCSAEYKRSCEEVDEQNRQRQAQLDKELHDDYMQRCEEYSRKCEEHNTAMQKYEEECIYHKDTEIPEWSNELTVLGTSLTETKSALKELYNKNIIPMKYRNRPALLWLATYIGTSQYDLQEAISRFDADVMQLMNMRQIKLAEAQLRVAQESLQNQQYANWLNEQLVELNEQGNKTLKSIDNWQKGDICLREYRRIKARRAAKARR